MMTQNEGQRKGTTNQVQKDDEGNENRRVHIGNHLRTFHFPYSLWFLDGHYLRQLVPPSFQVKVHN